MRKNGNIPQLLQERLQSFLTTFMFDGAQSTLTLDHFSSHFLKRAKVGHLAGHI